MEIKEALGYLIGIIQLILWGAVITLFPIYLIKLLIEAIL